MANDSVAEVKKKWWNFFLPPATVSVCIIFDGEASSLKVFFTMLQSDVVSLDVLELQYGS